MIAARLLTVCMAWSVVAPLHAAASDRSARLLREDRLIDALEIATQELADAHAAQAPLADPFLALAEVYYECGLYERAEELVSFALAHHPAEDRACQPWIANALRLSGRIAKDIPSSRLADARRHYEAAFAALEPCGDAQPQLRAELMEAMGHLLRRERRMPEAEQMLAAALQLRIATLGAASPELVRDWSGLGWFHLLEGRVAAAESCLARARALALLEPHDLPALSEAIYYHGRTRIYRGDDRGAEQAMTRALRLASTFADIAPVGFGYMRSGYGTEYPDLLVRLGEPEQAWHALESARGTLATKMAWLAAARDAPAHRELDGISAQVLELERLWSATPRAPTDLDAPALALWIDLLLADAQRMRREFALAPVLRDRPAAPECLRTAQQALAGDEAYIGWMTTPGWLQPRPTVRAFVIRDQGTVQWIELERFRSELEAQQWQNPRAELLRALQLASVWPTRVESDQELHELARTLYARWFAPLLPHLQGISRLIVVNSEAASALPVEMLENERGELVLQHFAISYAPSASLHAHLRARRARTAGAPTAALVVGAPVFQEAHLARLREVERMRSDAWLQLAASVPVDATLLRSVVSGEAGALERLPFLPHTLHEARSIAGMFEFPELRTGVAAGEAALETLRGSESRFDVVHFATHALVDDLRPDRSALALSFSAEQTADGRWNGLLTAREIALGWRFDADLVALSGCQTAWGSGSGTGELLGLQQAFLRAGARALLLSCWKVDDVATALLMQRFYENYTGHPAEPASARPRDRMPAAQALREAKLWLRDYRDAQGRAPFAHPVYWASFFLLGDSS